MVGISVDPVLWGPIGSSHQVSSRLCRSFPDYSCSVRVLPYGFFDAGKGPLTSANDDHKWYPGRFRSAEGGHDYRVAAEVHVSCQPSSIKLASVRISTDTLNHLCHTPPPFLSSQPGGNSNASIGEFSWIKVACSFPRVKYMRLPNA